MDYIVHLLKRLETDIPGETFFLNSSGKVVLGRTMQEIRAEWLESEVDETAPLEPVSAGDFETMLVETYRRAIQ